MTHHEYADPTTYRGVVVTLLGLGQLRAGDVYMNMPQGAFLSDLPGSDVLVELRAYFAGRSLVRKPIAVFISGVRDIQCMDESTVTHEGAANGPNDKNGVETQLYRSAFLVSKNGYIICSFNIPPFHKTFTERELRVSIDELGAPAFHQFRPARSQEVLFDISRFSQQHDVHASGVMRDNRVIANGSSDVVVSWRDVDAEQFRDILLVLVGGLLGTAAAAAFEWLRPVLVRWSR
ncbi:MAG TPA: hypothetical protein VFO29_01565 [Candidatus Rubrimentiphilum sp.]|nr:hypothetical protein [Candidatus Rubrimentiphilum sp.]